MNASSVPVRAAYLTALDPECLLPGAAGTRLRELLAAAAGPDSSRGGLIAEAAAWAGAQRACFEALAARAVTPGDRASVTRRAILGCAPLALRSGAWLQWLVGMAQADDSVALRALGLYAGDVGAGHPHASRGAAYLALMSSQRLARHASPAANLVNDQRIADVAFQLPAVLLLMSRLPDDFDAEIIGADLCLRAVGLLPGLSAVRAFVPADWDAIDPNASRSAALPPPLALASEIAAGWVGRADRFRLGFRWAYTELRGWNDWLLGDVEAALDPWHDMAELVRSRAREGVVYHDGLDLGGTSLRELLRTAREDPGPLLEALAASSWVRPGDSARSRLVGGLIGERGPMFRVFAPGDVDVIRRWIDGLASTSGRVSAVPPTGERRLALPPLGRPPTRPPDGRDDTGPRDLRDAYTRLLGRQDTPGLRAWAERYVRGWLDRSAPGDGESGLTLPSTWDPGGLRRWLSEEHHRHEMEFSETAALPVPGRDALIDSTMQLAPLTMIDGAWLRGFADYEQASSAIGFALFETYWDELGNGQTALNHPLIFRALVREMGVDLPPTASPEFARWKGFRDESFRLPVYWLSLGRFPRTFLPEVLGMNLAMELSGVGGSYRRARIALAAHGFSTTFVDIHNTIDNIASGHSAWATDAIHAYIATLQGEAVQQAWVGVRTGYRSLSTGALLWPAAT
ncbi:MAG TPA: iron-containing redox enzyme family protein [Trebonia sp.]